MLLFFFGEEEREKEFYDILFFMLICFDESKYEYIMILVKIYNLVF